jgi:hypothetical protein
LSYGNFVISYFDKNLLRENDDQDDYSIMESLTIFM